ncbi:MAG: hypothetical protein WEF53_13225 [Bacteroidota bacterium]
MKKRHFLSLAPILVAVLMLFFSSCSKEDNPAGPGGDPAQAATKATQGHEVLIPKIALLVNSGGADSTVFDFSTASSLYNEALALDPTNADAHFGLALIDLLSFGSNPSVWNIAGQMGDFKPVFMESLMNPSAGTAGILTQYGTALRDRFASSFDQRIQSALGKRTALAANPISYYQSILETAILPNLISAINHLNITLANTSYALLITPTMTGGNTTDTYRIDATEIYLLRGFLQFLTADISALVAYNFDYDPSDSAGVLAAWQPTSPFLAFRPSGATRMAAVRSNFIGAANSIQGSLNFLMNEQPNAQVDLIEYNPADASAFQEVIAILDTVKKFLSGPYQFPDGPTINLQQFFDNAIPNYKLKIPSYTVGVQAGFEQGKYDALLTFNAATFNDWVFPDPTMNGFFPGMTDADLKLLLEVSADNWEQTIIVPGRSGGEPIPE